MEGLAEFLSSKEATWQPVGQSTSLCVNEDIEERLEFLPEQLRTCEPRVWKTTGNLTITSPEGRLLPIKIIGGKPQIFDGKTTKGLVAGSEPVPFKKGDVLSGNLYYITTQAPST